MSVEVIKKLSYTTKVDIWSLGVVMYELLSCEFPFPPASSRGELCKMINTYPISYEGKGWENVSKIAKDFVSHMLLRN